MKRVVKASTRDDLRVVNVSMDVVLPSGVDGWKVAQEIQDLVNDNFGNACRVAAADVGGEITSIYKEQYPDEIFI